LNTKHTALGVLAARYGHGEDRRRPLVLGDGITRHSYPVRMTGAAMAEKTSPFPVLVARTYLILSHFNQASFGRALTRTSYS
jgi:hypothetical protein